MWGTILGGVSNLLGSNLIGKVFGNKEAREAQIGDEQEKVLDEFSAENLQHRENRTWWDSLVDGLNRLPRPLGFLMTVAVLLWPIFDPQAFALAMQAYVLVPEWLVQLIFGVWALYFWGRILSKDLKIGGPSAKAVTQMLSNQTAIRQAFAEVSSQTSPPPSQAPAPQSPVVDSDPYSHTERLPNDAYESALKAKTPLSLPAIVEWNRRNNQQ